MDLQEKEICKRRNSMSKVVEGRAAPGRGRSWKGDMEMRLVGALVHGTGSVPLSSRQAISSLPLLPGHPKEEMWWRVLGWHHRNYPSKYTWRERRKDERKEGEGGRIGGEKNGMWLK